MKITWYNLVLTACLTAVLFFSFSSANESTAKEDRVDIADTGSQQLPQDIRSVMISKEFYFAGERIPKENQDVKERLERELHVNSYRHSATIDYLKLMNRYFPLIESILRQENVPVDFKYLAVAESGLRPAVSSAGARGIWQFMKGTGQQYNLEINSGIDERYHVEKSTRAAAKYLHDLKDRFGSWTLAAAAYNMGPTAMSKDLALQKETSYYNMNLSRETMRYVFSIAALKEIHENSSLYGFNLDPIDLYEPLDNVHAIPVESTIESLADFAHKYNATYRELKMYNPWLLNSKLPNSSGRKYFVLLPRK